ncbi:hypothetical protein [Mycoplasma seminis]|uniref:Uncharacterized protein n=1 Tax=Mycoplasma seminis TaxID=512749 RepID=A0ABY9H9D5_9MOLU|nr:hypothetical protein [Mycoplasma seminis]WLP85195.1 hypothetical protein Q8852_02635 [Mycoplasma seminis]
MFAQVKSHLQDKIENNEEIQKFAKSYLVFVEAAIAADEVKVEAKDKAEKLLAELKAKNIAEWTKAQVLELASILFM